MNNKNSAEVRKKRCLIVYHFFAHYRLHVLHALMGDKEWDFELVSASDSEGGIKGIDPALASKPVDEGGLSWTFVENTYPFGKRLPFLWQRGLLKRLRRDDYDAIIFLGSIHYFSTWIAARLAKVMKKPVLFWTHGLLGKDGRIMLWLRNIFYRQADACLLYGVRAKQLMLSSGRYEPERLKVIYNSLDYTELEKCRLELGVEEVSSIRQSLFHVPDVPVVVAVGRVNQVKRFDMLVEAVAQLHALDVRVNCLIVGDGPELEAVQALAEERGVSDWVVCLGARYGRDADELLCASDLCVIPGDVGLSAMHSMAAGLPVISHDCFERQMPEHEAIVPGKTGAFYRYGSVSALAEVIEDWIVDIPRLKQARSMCVERIRKHYHVQNQQGLIVETLNRCVAERGG